MLSASFSVNPNMFHLKSTPLFFVWKVRTRLSRFGKSGRMMEKSRWLAGVFMSISSGSLGPVSGVEARERPDKGVVCPEAGGEAAAWLLSARHWPAGTIRVGDNSWVSRSN